MPAYTFVANALGAAYLAQIAYFILEADRDDVVAHFADPSYNIAPHLVDEHVDRVLAVADGFREAAIAVVEAQEIADAAEAKGTLDA